MSEAYKPYEPTSWERRIDAMFGLVSPKAALNRMVDRERMHHFRYLAAQPSNTRQNAHPTTAGEWLRIQREKMQVMWNAIDMVDNSGLCSGILIKFPTYVCGTLRWQAKTGDKSVNKAYQDYIKQKIDKPSNIDITGRFTLRQQCMLDIKSIALKGDVGTNIVREDDEIYLQGIEANRIGDPYRWVTSDSYVRGLNIDPRTGRPVSARIYHQDRRNGNYKYDGTFEFRDERGLPKFLFFTNPLSFDDYRGVSLFKHAIDNATYIDRMRTYELQALLWAASMSGVYYTKSGSLPEQLPFSRTPVQDRDGNTIDTFEARPNTIVALSSEGEKVEMFQHLRPSPNVIGMYENTVRDIAIGAGLTYGFAYDMAGITGPAVRQCSAQDARAIQIWQEMLRDQKLDPVVMLLLGDAIASGELPYHPNWLSWDWFFPAKPTIDVGRESEASIKEIEAGVNTGANVVAESGMGDVEDVITQRGHEIDLMIEAAQKIAKEKKLEWQEVYALMIPPPRGSGRNGATAAAGAAGAKADRNPDKRGASDDGVDLNSNGSERFEVKKKDDSCFVIETDDSIIEFYDPSQTRDYHGRFTDEGSDLAPHEKEMLQEFKREQKEFEKKTGKIGQRFDAVLTGDPLPEKDLAEHIAFLGNFQHKNMLARATPEQKEKLKYGGTADFLLNEGEWFDVPDEPPQIELMTPRECYSNATKMMLKNPSRYEYVEGLYASSHLPFPIEHAWLSDKETGKVVDPTLGWQPKSRYFGVAYTKKFVIRKMVDNGYYGIHSNGHMMNDVVLGTDKDYKYK